MNIYSNLSVRCMTIASLIFTLTILPAGLNLRRTFYFSPFIPLDQGRMRENLEIECYSLVKTL